MSLIKMGLIAYGENTSSSIPDIIQELKDSGLLSSYAYIYHDKDTDDKGELKKPHYHIYLRFNVSTNQNAIAKKFGISTNLIQRISNVSGYLAYFVHEFDKDKFQYSLDNVVEWNCSVLDAIDLCYSNDIKENRESEVIRAMIELLYQFKSLRKVMNWALEFNYWDIFRKNYTILKDLLYNNE